MLADARPLYGQLRALTLVRELMERPDQDRRLRSRHSPVLIFSGSRGIGKTELLASLARLLDQNVPYARVDFETTDATSPGEVLSAVAIDLNRHCAGYGRLGFPRFVVGRIVMAQELNFTDPEQVRAQIERKLEEHSNVPKLRQFLRSLAPEVMATLTASRGVPGAVTVGKYLPDVLLDGLISWRAGRRVVLGVGQSWYGHQDRGLSRDSLDVLAELNRRCLRLDVKDNRQEVDELLLAAFLADLRAAFGSGWRARRRSLNCVVLLDNADTPVGHDFLEQLVRARRLHAAYAPQDPDPVTVVATSRGRLVSRVMPAAADVAALDDAGFDDYHRRSRRSSSQWWYPVALRHLAEDEVGNMVAALGLGTGSDRRIAAAVYQFTGGHPGSTRLVLEALAERPDGPTDLQPLLAQPEPGSLGTQTVRERLRTGFLVGYPTEEAAQADLVTCAAARDQEEASRLAAYSGLLAESRVDVAPVFQTELWSAREDGGSSVMQPVLRRLLLSELAARADDVPAAWARVHRWLCEQAAHDDDETGALYHTLAQGDLEGVARQLAGRLEAMAVDDWLRLLWRVVAAPAPFEPSLAPMVRVHELTRWADPRDLPTAPLARLVAGLWLDADPLTGSRRRELHLNVRAAYVEIAPFSPNGLAALHARAEQHVGLAELWR